MSSALPEVQALLEVEREQEDAEIAAIVMEAMQDAWNDICADSGHHPQDLHREGRKLYFTPAHWASLAGQMTAVALRKAGFQKAGGQ